LESTVTAILPVVSLNDDPFVKREIDRLSLPADPLAVAAAEAHVQDSAVAPTKTQLIDWIRSAFTFEELPRSQLKKIQLYLNGQLLNSFEDVVKLGPDGVRALTVPKKIRALLWERLVHHIGVSQEFDDQRMVTVPEIKPPAKKSKCFSVSNDLAPKHLQMRFASDATANSNANADVNERSLVGDWLRRMFPDVPALKMTRAIKALKRQTITTFADLRRVGVNGVAALLHVPGGVREKLHEAILWDLGVAGGHDDERMVPYIEPKPKLMAPPSGCSRN